MHLSTWLYCFHVQECSSFQQIHSKGPAQKNGISEHRRVQFPILICAGPVGKIDVAVADVQAFFILNPVIVMYRDLCEGQALFVSPWRAAAYVQHKLFYNNCCCLMPFPLYYYMSIATLLKKEPEPW